MLTFSLLLLFIYPSLSYTLPLQYLRSRLTDSYSFWILCVSFLELPFSTIFPTVYFPFTVSFKILFLHLTGCYAYNTCSLNASSIKFNLLSLTIVIPSFYCLSELFFPYGLTNHHSFPEICCPSSHLHPYIFTQITFFPSIANGFLIIK